MHIENIMNIIRNHILEGFLLCFVFFESSIYLYSTYQGLLSSGSEPSRHCWAWSPTQSLDLKFD